MNTLQGMREVIQAHMDGKVIEYKIKPVRLEGYINLYLKDDDGDIISYDNLCADRLVAVPQSTREAAELTTIEHGRTFKIIEVFPNETD